MVGIVIVIVIVLLSGDVGKHSLEWICAAGGSGGNTNSLEWILCRFLLIVIFTLFIPKYNVIDGIIRSKFKKRFQFQFYKNITKYVIGR